MPEPAAAPGGGVELGGQGPFEHLGRGLRIDLVERGEAGDAILHPLERLLLGIGPPPVSVAGPEEVIEQRLRSDGLGGPCGCTIDVVEVRHQPRHDATQPVDVDDGSLQRFERFGQLTRHHPVGAAEQAIPVAREFGGPIPPAGHDPRVPGEELPRARAAEA